MKIGIIADTHNREEMARKAIDVFVSNGVEYIIHAGDWASPEMVDLFYRMTKDEQIPVVGVLGNNDMQVAEMIDKEGTLGVDIEGDIGEWQVSNKRIAVYHGTKKSIMDELVESGEYDIIVKGHTHKVSDMKIGNTRVINPGSPAFVQKGFGKTIGIYDTEEDELKIVDLSSEKSSTRTVGL